MKRFKHSSLSIAISSIILSGFSLNAIAAQEIGAQEVERIEVTGSRIKRSDLESSVPVSVFTAADIKASGAPTLEQFVQSLPIMNGRQYGSNINNAGTGEVQVSFRGLGSSRTLVLLNGKRYRNDITSIPMAAVERVEVVRDGASAIYGSDAIAGVMNFVTYTSYTGLEFSAQHQETSEGDGTTSTAGFVGGVEFDKGNIVFSGGFEERDTIYGKDRKFSSCVPKEVGTGADRKLECGGSTFSHPASFSFQATDGLPDISGLQVLDGNSYRAFSEPTDGYNHSEVSILYQPLKKHNFFTAMNYDLIDEGFTTARFSSEFNYTNRISNQKMAPVGTFWQPEMSVDHPDNPFGRDINVRRRLVETGGRSWSREVDQYSYSLGFNGEFQNTWAWNASYTNNQWKELTDQGGRVNQLRTGLLLDPQGCAGNSECSQVGLWNPLLPDSLTQDQLDWIIVPLSDYKRQNDSQFQVNLAGDTGEFELPGGTISWAIGYEYLTTKLLIKPDGAAAMNEVYGVTADATQGAYNTTSYYAEVNLPVLADLPFAKRLDISGAIRRTDVNIIDKAETTSKIGIEWRPVDGLLLRASNSDGFRVPTIRDLLDPQEESADNHTDPCHSFSASSDANIIANCQADGLAFGWEQPDAQTGAWTGGNTEVQPEKSTSNLIGMVYSPSFVDNLTITLDYYDIEIENVIASLSATTIAAQCYGSSNFSSPLCAYMEGAAEYGLPASPTSFRRDAGGSLKGIRRTTQNLSVLTTSGVDFDIDYSVEALGGEFNFNLEGTYASKLERIEASGIAPTELVGFYGNDPINAGIGTFNQIKSNFTARYSQDEWSLSWTARYIDETENLIPNDTNLVNIAPAYTYHDVQGVYHLDMFTFAAGIRNLADKQPPYISGVDNSSGTIRGTYDLLGRQYYLQTTIKF
ncbi:TonB-dependent receptor plug domain-containing protein [Pseudoalteromonas denitrificans]|uniref:Iron complex outermembrane recepter protein n=1 Tax=Pseudoalteromonas denitrificans DSM 6059 TaxID=1123010 RepID=A0A1I1J6V3_9GAMM|nr:TonB-dependent receptor [Pseudoalteromonas denitrificans]SFC42338.1 iron complex outermembrane recepter protein [Pseudoalteromonas denitrificans DSM 6059]